MPRRKASETERFYQRIALAIQYYQNMYHISSSELARLLSISMPTFYRRIHQPQSFTICELYQLANKFNITPEMLFQNPVKGA